MPEMKPILPIFAVALVTLGLTACSVSRPATGPVLPLIPGSRARYEILGMLSEYQGRTLGADEIESFYPSEKDGAAHFEALLREFCDQEQIPKRWRRSKGEVGHVTFSSAKITAMLDAHYMAQGDRFWFVENGRRRPAWHGTLKPSVILSASRAEQLRYVRGCHMRSGTGAPEWTALFHSANEFRKFALLAEVLRRLGCRNVKVYNDYASGNVPTSYVLTFTPTVEIKALTGIQREVTPAELRKWDGLKELKTTTLLPAP